MSDPLSLQIKNNFLTLPRNKEPDVQVYDLEAIDEWNRKLKEKIFECDIANDMNSLIELLDYYLQSLNGCIGHKFARNVLRHIQTFYTLFQRIVRGQEPEQYLQLMEDILTIYCNLEVSQLNCKEEINKIDQNKAEQKVVHALAKKIIYILNVNLLRKQKHILHVLLKLSEAPLIGARKILLNVLFTQILMKDQHDVSDEAFCRHYILFQIWKDFRPEDEWERMDNYVYGIFNRQANCMVENETINQILTTMCSSHIDVIMSIQKTPQDLVEAYFNYMRNKRVVQRPVSINLDPDAVAHDETLPGINGNENEDDDITKLYHKMNLSLSIVPSGELVKNTPITTIVKQERGDAIEDVEFVEDCFQSDIGFKIKHKVSREPTPELCESRLNSVVANPPLSIGNLTNDLPAKEIISSTRSTDIPPEQQVNPENEQVTNPPAKIIEPEPVVAEETVICTNADRIEGTTREEDITDTTEQPSTRKPIQSESEENPETEISPMEKEPEPARDVVESFTPNEDPLITTSLPVSINLSPDKLVKNTSVIPINGSHSRMPTLEREMYRSLAAESGIHKQPASTSKQISSLTREMPHLQPHNGNKSVDISDDQTFFPDIVYPITAHRPIRTLDNPVGKPNRSQNINVLFPKPNGIIEKTVANTNRAKSQEVQQNDQKADTNDYLKGHQSQGPSGINGEPKKDLRKVLRFHQSVKLESNHRVLRKARGRTPYEIAAQRMAKNHPVEKYKNGDLDSEKPNGLSKNPNAEYLLENEVQTLEKKSRNADEHLEIGIGPSGINGQLRNNIQRIRKSDENTKMDTTESNMDTSKNNQNVSTKPSYMIPKRAQDKVNPGMMIILKRYPKIEERCKLYSDSLEKMPRLSFLLAPKALKRPGNVTTNNPNDTDDPPRETQQLVDGNDQTKLKGDFDLSQDKVLNLKVSSTKVPDPELEFSNSPKFLADSDKLVKHCLENVKEESAQVKNKTPLLCDNSNFYKTFIPNNASNESKVNVINEVGAQLPTAVPDSYDFDKGLNLKNEVFSKILDLPDFDWDTKLPIKKRKLANSNEEEIMKKEEEISYPATPMISIAEVEALNSLAGIGSSVSLTSININSRPKTLAERKELTPLPGSYIHTNPIITDRFNINNHTYNNATINLNMNNIPVPFINIPCGSYSYSLPPILLPFNGNFNNENIVEQPELKKERKKPTRPRRK